MRELSLNVLDVVQNSISAGAKLIEIVVEIQKQQNTMSIHIIDNGCGMSNEQIEKVTNPFYTTRTTRKIGLGVPLFKMSTEMTGGSFSISSEISVGTVVKAQYKTDHIDMTPLGNMNETVTLLIACNPDIDFVYKKKLGAKELALDTRELREVLGGDVALNNSDVVGWIRDNLAEQEDEINSSS